MEKSKILLAAINYRLANRQQLTNIGLNS